MKLKIFVISFCFTCANVALAQQAPTVSKCRDEFKLKGKTDKPWADITLSEWNEKILPKIWIDKGGHFLKQIKKRGNEGSIDTPSDLQYFFRGATAETNTHGTAGYVMKKNDASKSVEVYFDINSSSKKCELVTFVPKSK